MCILSVITLPVAFLVGLFTLVRGTTDTKDFCTNDALDITCSYGDVIIIDQATYGRMRFNRCIHNDDLGCNKDVTSHLEAWCSGRQNCNNRFTDLIDLKTCRKDLMGYLEVKFHCVTVATGHLNACQGTETNKYVSLTNGNGYIAPYLDGKKYGISSCPYSIRVNPGQKVNITLLDFNDLGKDLGTSITKTEDYYKKECPLNLKVEETSRPTSQQICVGRKQNSRLYVSSTNSVLIHFEYLVPDSDKVFLLHYSTSGCENLVAPTYGWLIADSAKVQVRCNFTGEIWYLTCEDNEWIGEIGSCPSEAEALLLKASNSNEFPFGLVVAVIIGIILGVFIGVCLLGMVYACRRSAHKNDPNINNIYGQPNHARDIDIYSDRMGGILPPIPKDHITRVSDYGYFPTMPPKSHADSPQHKQITQYIHDGNRTAPRIHQQRSHIYESPTFANRIENRSIPPVYHELDSDIGNSGRYTN